MTPTPHTAEALAAEMQRYGVTTMNRWATDGATLIRSQAQEIENLKAVDNLVLRGAELVQSDLESEINGLRAENAKLREALTAHQIDEAISNWFADGWAQKAARGMLADLGITKD